MSGGSVDTFETSAIGASLAAALELTDRAAAQYFASMTGVRRVSSEGSPHLRGLGGEVFDFQVRASYERC